MPLHEEHMDLFGTVTSGVYTYDKAVTSSAVTSNVIHIDKTIPNWDAFLLCNQDFAGTSTKVTITVSASNALSSGALDSAVTVYTKEILTASLKKGILDKIVLPKGYEYFTVTVTPDTTSSAAFTGGKVCGYVVPEFN